MPTEFETIVAELEAGTHAPDPRTDVDTASLRERYPELAAVETTDLTIPGRHGDIPARLYRAPGGVRAAFVWVHGGSFIGGDLDMPEANWPPLALAARGIPTLSVDYRKALHGVRFPVPSDDVVDAWNWAVSNAESLGVAASALQLGGASAGGNLVAGAMLRLRDGEGQLPASAVLVYPAIHDELPEPSDELRKALTDEEWAGGVVGLREIALNYAGDAAAAKNPYAFASHDALGGLPPILILNSDLDTLRASGEAFGEQLSSAGASVTVTYEPGTPHGHLNLPHSPAAHASIATIAAWLTTSVAEGETTISRVE